MPDFSVLKQIADRHILQGLFCKEIGLWQGKMGMALFFYFYARHTYNRWYEEFANELLDDICNELSSQIPVAFANGLCGIGWGIEFLKAQRFIEGDTDEILCEIDKEIMERDVRRISDYSLETGLEGIAVYVRSRLDSHRTPGEHCLPFDTDYLKEINEACQKADIGLHSEKYELYSVWNRLLQHFSKTPVSGEKNWQKGLAIITKENE